MAKANSNNARQPVPPDSGPNRSFALAVGALMVLGLAVVAFVATRSDSGDGQTAAVEIAGDSLPVIPDDVRITDADTDPAYGAVAPTLTATGFDGTEITIGPDGSAKAIYFLAHWCPHCQAEVPLVQALIDSGAVPEGMDVYAVSTSVNSGQDNYPPEAWFEAEGFTGVVVRDDGNNTSMRSFGGSSFPYALYLDSEHRVIARSAGSLDGPITEQLWTLAAEG